MLFGSEGRVVVRTAGVMLLLALAGTSAAAQADQGSSTKAVTAGCSDYAGRYLMPDRTVLIVAWRDGVLTARPIFWRSVQRLAPAGKNTFAVPERPERQLVFQCGDAGRVTSVSLLGFSDGGERLPRIGPELTPSELLMQGKPELAARLLVREGPQDPAAFVKLARAAIENFSSHSLAAAAFVKAALPSFPRSSALAAVLGDAYISAGQRGAALTAYRRAHELDRRDPWPIRALERLNVRPADAPAVKDAGWTVPFSLDRLFMPPTLAEIAQVWADWAKRDLEPREVTEVKRGHLKLGEMDAEARIYSYRIHDEKNYGAVIVPYGLGTAPAPVIVDLKGVSPDFFPLQLTRLVSPPALGADAGRFVYVVPSFRGERLIFDGQEFQSEGDPNDSWDGATDDSIAFLTAALAATPQADSARIAAFGKSRGGTLALLMGIRDRRIKLVEDWSGPVDWFRLVGAYGWNPREIEGDALRYRVKPEEDGGQFVGTFLTKAIKGERGLEAVRLHMLASSPVFFADRLPVAQAHHGVEDEMVPAQNGRELLAVFNARRLLATDHQIFFYPDSGHDLYEPLARSRAREFLVTHLLGKN
jgi:hypothetical protein